MKKSHSPGGTRICMRVLFYSIAFVAVIGTRETLSDRTGPISANLGRAFNQTLMASSKLGIGFALMIREQTPDESQLGRYGRSLGIASHKAFIFASEMDPYIDR